MIALPPLGDLDLELWHALLDVADREPADWTLIGGQMVLLHALEHGRAPLRVSQDIDLVVDARVRPPALARIVTSLIELGFAEAAISADEIAHRFQRGRVAIDVPRPGWTGLQNRSAHGGRRHDRRGRRGNLRAGPIRARERVRRQPAWRGASPGPRGSDPHQGRRRDPRRSQRARTALRDLAFLVSLVSDPIAMHEDLGAANSARVRGVEALQDPAHAAWGLLGDETVVADAHVAFRLITAAP